jgi:uncharacterized protein (TIGR00730 family)
MHAPPAIGHPPGISIPVMKRVCVFCGSSPGTRPEYGGAARWLGAALARRGIGLVYGGASIGVMGAVADAVLAGGGEAIGVIPRSIVEREVAHSALSELHVVDSMHQRKAMMAELADAFITLPGGLGTLEELFEVWTWGLLGIHDKPFGLLDVEGYFTPLIAFLDHAVVQGFIREPHRAMALVDSDPERLLDRLAAYRPPPGERVIEPSES